MAALPPAVVLQLVAFEAKALLLLPFGERRRCLDLAVRRNGLVVRFGASATQARVAVEQTPEALLYLPARDAWLLFDEVTRPQLLAYEAGDVQLPPRHVAAALEYVQAGERGSRLRKPRCLALGRLAIAAAAAQGDGAVVRALLRRQGQLLAAAGRYRSCPRTARAVLRSPQLHRGQRVLAAASFVVRCDTALLDEALGMAASPFIAQELLMQAHWTVRSSVPSMRRLVRHLCCSALGCLGRACQEDEEIVLTLLRRTMTCCTYLCRGVELPPALAACKAVVSESLRSGHNPGGAFLAAVPEATWRDRSLWRAGLGFSELPESYWAVTATLSLAELRSYLPVQRSTAKEAHLGRLLRLLLPQPAGVARNRCADTLLLHPTVNAAVVAVRASASRSLFLKTLSHFPPLLWLDETLSDVPQMLSVMDRWESEHFARLDPHMRDPSGVCYFGPTRTRQQQIASLFQLLGFATTRAGAEALLQLYGEGDVPRF